MNIIENKLKHAILKATQHAGIGDSVTIDSIVIELPKDKKNGDFSTNIAMQLTKLLKQNPKSIAERIVNAIDQSSAGIERIDIAGPGFINFYMSHQSLTGVLNEIVNKDIEYGRTNHGKGVRYNVEFVSANPTGNLHLGHARQAAQGDSICRLLEFAGYHVTREYYINDAGNQIHNLAVSTIARYHQELGIPMEMPADGYFGADIIEIAKLIIAEHGNAFVNDSSESTYWLFRNKARFFQLEKIKRDLEYFRVKFDVWSSETEIRDRGSVELTLDLLKKSGHTYEQEGALWLKTTDFGDDKDRVLVKSDGSYTYVMPDIAYHNDKYSRGHDYLVDLLGADHHGYIARMKAAVTILGQRPEQLEIDIIQMVRLIRDGVEVKMSKRSGNAITIRDLCEEVGIDAVRYFFIMRSGNAHLDFDLGLAEKQSSENPVYYAQYAHARMASIIDNANTKGITASYEGMLLKTEFEKDVMIQLHEFPDVVNKAADDRAPHQIALYVQKLAQTFHVFYNNCYVIDENELTLSSQRLGLVNATRIVLKNALNLIGVTAPNKM